MAFLHILHLIGFAGVGFMLGHCKIFVTSLEFWVIMGLVMLISITNRILGTRG
jgi:hypothetical protein